MTRRSLPYREDRPIVPELSAGGVVRTPDGKRVLVLHEIAENRWCFPKGHVDPGESLLQAARREIGEETGLVNLSFLGEVAEVTYRFYDDRRGTNVLKVVAYFAFEAVDAKVTVEPIFDRGEWMAPEEAGSSLRLTDLKVLARAQELGYLPRRGTPREP